METKHTKGKWYLPHFAKDDCTCDCGYLFGGDNNPVVIATVHYDNGDGSIQNDEYYKKEEAIANAKLICAAPIMLETLLFFKENIDDYFLTGIPSSIETATMNYHKIEQAIKKATE